MKAKANNSLLPCLFLNESEYKLIMQNVKTRKNAREILFFAIYISDLLKKWDFDIDKFDLLISSSEIELKLNDGDKNFIVNYYLKIKLNLEKIDNLIKKNLKKWDFSRINCVERSLLRIGVYELKFESIDHKIAINESVEIAKKYGEEKTSKFINGVLANVIKIDVVETA